MLSVVLAQQQRRIAKEGMVSYRQYLRLGL